MLLIKVLRIAAHATARKRRPPSDRQDQISAAQLDLARRGLFVESTGVACWAAMNASPDVLGGRDAVVPLCGAGAKTGPA
ncbi:hypothetical protein GCM10020367_41490 [Streptomyces sannanensis]|uniref:Transcriptional regulator n=1 Tax=Streptomyces sannanensis TaxID=285536 RepID=A0ABP6SEU4_9ACTN